MKKIFFYLILTLFIFSCSKKTTIPEDFYYTPDDKQINNKNNTQKPKNQVDKNKNDSKNNNKNVNDNKNKNKNNNEVENKIQKIIDYSKKFIGTPYKYGGTTPQGFDCSGFIVYVFKNNGVELSGNAISLAKQCTRITKSEIKAGDLVFFKGSNINSGEIGHVALVIETSGNDFKMIHATTSKGIVINDFGQYEYWKNRFLFAARVLIN